MWVFIVVMLIAFVVAVVKDNGWYFLGIMVFNLFLLLATHTPEELTPEKVYTNDDINRESTMKVKKLESICDTKGGVQNTIVNYNIIQDDTVIIICKDNSYHNFNF